MPLAGLSVHQQAVAQQRWEVLRPHVQGGVPLTRAASEAGVPLRTVQRWLARYRAGGLDGLARAPRSDQGVRRAPPEVVRLIEGLALRRPRPNVATIRRQVVLAASEHGWPAPSYSTVHAIVTALDPQLMTLAHEGPVALRDRYELVYRRQAERPNAVWQADHTELDLLIVDADGTPARPWLTVVLDDCSRAVAGYSLFLGAPSTLNLSLALRQAIWRKSDPAWAVHGLPEVLYVDHGSDFTSDHLAAVAADLHIELVHSAVARPQGRGKIERFFGTLMTELLPQLPGQLVRGHPAPTARLTLAEADAALGAWISGTYHQRPHGETGKTPQRAWLGEGWLPRTPDADQLMFRTGHAVPRYPATISVALRRRLRLPDHHPHWPEPQISWIPQTIWPLAVPTALTRCNRPELRGTMLAMCLAKMGSTAPLDLHLR